MLKVFLKSLRPKPGLNSEKETFYSEGWFLNLHGLSLEFWNRLQTGFGRYEVAGYEFQQMLNKGLQYYYSYIILIGSLKSGGYLQAGYYCNPLC